MRLRIFGCLVIVSYRSYRQDAWMPELVVLCIFFLAQLARIYQMRDQAVFGSPVSQHVS
jgi:hypothetical protein